MRQFILGISEILMYILFMYVVCWACLALAIKMDDEEEKTVEYIEFTYLVHYPSFIDTVHVRHKNPHNLIPRVESYKGTNSILLPPYTIFSTTAPLQILN